MGACELVLVITQQDVDFRSEQGLLDSMLTSVDISSIHRHDHGKIDIYSHSADKLHFLSYCPFKAKLCGC